MHPHHEELSLEFGREQERKRIRTVFRTHFACHSWTPLRIAIAKVPSHVTFHEQLEPFLRIGVQIEDRPVVLRRIPDLELVRMRMALGMEVEKLTQQRPTRTLNLRNQHERLVNADGRLDPSGKQRPVLVPERIRLSRPRHGSALTP